MLALGVHPNHRRVTVRITGRPRQDRHRNTKVVFQLVDDLSTVPGVPAQIQVYHGGIDGAIQTTLRFC